MSQDQLQKFFHEKRQRTHPANRDWSSKRDEWIAAVQRLYETLENNYLRSARADVNLSREDKVVTEENVGEYHIPEFVLRVGDERGEKVVFSPKGINIVAAKGRIDIVGDRGDAMLVWEDGDNWSIVASRTPKIRLVPLSADSLTEVLRDVMRP